jgi:GAF domain-containing protein
MIDAARTFSSAGRLALGRLGLLGSRRSRADQTGVKGPRGRLFRKYVLLFIGLVSLVLLVNGALDFWFSYRENKAALVRIQQEKAESAARRIEQFVDEIEHQIGWTTAAQWAANPLEQRRFDYFRLMRQVPAITELIQLDGTGKEQLKVSRLAPNVVGSEADYSQSPSFTEAQAHRVWFSQVHFRKKSEPYMTLAMASSGRKAGVTIAQVNLKLIWDVVTALKIGKAGYAYVVDRDGRLIAHPDISLVLRNTDLSALPQVAAARAAAAGQEAPLASATIAENMYGKSVLTAHAAIAPLGWLVFVELPFDEALAPLYGSGLRTAALLALGLCLATLAALFLARQMVVPIRAMQQGAARIGAGELDRRIDIRTGDELEALAGQFNEMAADLQKSYADLEKKVEDRTAELTEALDQQTATADVLQVINSSPGDLAPVFDAMLEKAMRLCDAAFGYFMSYDGEKFESIALRGVSPEFAEFLRREPLRPSALTGLGRIARGARLIHVPDLLADEAYRLGDPVRVATVELGGARTWLGVPLLKDDRLLGVLMAYRQEVRPFSDKQIALLQNFAAQAVIAMENARLITETREALDQQTATAEVLGVINSSPGDLTPVFDAMLEKAHTLCGAALGSLVTYDGEYFHVAAAHGYPPEYMALIRQPSRPPPNSPFERLVRGERLVHIPDTTALPPWADDPIRRAAVDIVGIRTALFVPLRKDGALLGYISAQRQKVHPFSDKEIALIENFAAQAVIAMENARLITETREALDQQTATAEVLGVINSSPGDLAPVFEAMLEKATRMCEAETAHLLRYENEVFSRIASLGVPEDFDKILPLNTPVPHIITRDSIPYRMVATRAVVHVHDSREDESVRAGAPDQTAAAASGIRTALFVPLLKEGDVVGGFVVHRMEVRPFADKQIALLQNFAAQAVIAMENARLITETREALEQQTATAEVLGVINSSPGDLAPVFDAMLQKATGLCEAAFGILLTWDGEGFHRAAWVGAPGELIDATREETLMPAADSLAERFVHGEKVVSIDDLVEDERYRHGAGVQALVRLGGARSYVGVALRKDASLLGVIAIYRQEVRPFSDKQITLLQNFAAQAVIAMENARLLTETREALEQQTATAEVLGVINSSPGDLAPVFDAMLEKAHTLCGADYGALLTYDGERFWPLAGHGGSARFAGLIAEGGISPPTDGALWQLTRGAPFAQIDDMTKLAARRSDDPLTRALVEIGGIRTQLVVPLRKDETLLGAITANRHEVRPFSDKQIALLQNFAAQAVIAMENARLITETREALEQQTATAEVLGVINSSPGDLAPVFNAVLEKAHHLCGATQGALIAYDGEHFRAVATNGVPEPFAEVLRQPFPASPGSPQERMLNGEHLVHIPDATALEGYRVDFPVARASLEAGIRTLLMVPLRKDRALLGYITALRQEVQPFSEKQIALLQSFAAQAVIAMENARLITETREALEQQTATAEVLQVINSSPGDLAPVFDAMLEKAMHLCEAAFGILWTYDGERLHAAAIHGATAAYTEFLTSVLHRPTPSNLHGRLLGGGHLAHFTDVAASEDYKSGDPMPRALVDLGGGRTLLGVPLRKDSAFLGDIVIYRREVRPFSDKQIALLQNFAAQAVIAMENARLITETREALEQQTATAEVLGVINSSPGDLAPVFDAMLEKATRLCEAALGQLWTYDGSWFEMVASRGVPPDFAEFLQGRHRPGPGTVHARVAAGEDLVHVADIADEELYRSGDPHRKRTVELGGARSMLAVSLRQDEKLFGILTIYRQEVRPFSEKEIALVQNFAAQAVIAMENVRLITELRQRTRDLQESLEYQTATSDVLKVISRSAEELDAVLDTLVETAARICEADKAVLQQLSNGLYRMGASFGFSQDFKDYRARNPIRPDRGTPIGRMTLERRVVQIEDALNDAEFADVESQRLGEFRTMLAVPLFREAAVIGGLFLARSRVEPFTEKQIALVATFADQAVIAIENARLFKELRARTAELGRSVDELTMLSEVGQAVSSTLDLRAVLSTILTRSVGLTGADAGAVYRYSRADRSFRLAEAVGWDAALLRSIGDLRILESETAMGEATARRTPVQLADLAQRPSAPLRDVSIAAGFRGALIVPLVGPERILGALVLQRRAAGEFSPETVQLMQTLASQSVLAIQNARLFREIADKSEQLALASEHKSQFLANMSHELRTPLNAILGYAELLVDGIYGQLPERPSGVLERIQNNGRHLLALINDVLDLAKIEAGQLTLTLEDYSLPEMVQSVVTATEPLATSKGLKFTAVVQDSMPMAHGDARRVSQVLLNLVGNAIKFTDEGEVEIRAAVERGQFVLSVRDTGPGIPDADQERIFGEFQQIDNSNTRKKGGTGLGLAISKRMVEMQGGMISVQSVLGQGSTFRVVLPVHVDEVMEAA